MGAEQALRQCRRQFENSTWNCSTAEAGSLFGVVLKNGESALVPSSVVAEIRYLHGLVRLLSYVNPLLSLLADVCVGNGL